MIVKIISYSFTAFSLIMAMGILIFAEGTNRWSVGIMMVATGISLVIFGSKWPLKEVNKDSWLYGERKIRG